MWVSVVGGGGGGGEGYNNQLLKYITGDSL